MNRSASEDNYAKKPQSALINYKGNLSSLTYSSNQQSLKNQECFDSIASKSGIYYKLESIKKFLNKKSEKVEFDQILSNLDSINQVRFLKNRIELKENTKEKGYIEKDTVQYFDIKTRGCSSPIYIFIDTLKGSVEAYLSFTNCVPNKDFFDKRFLGSKLELHSKFIQFMENKCYIGVHAKTNALIEIYFINKKISGETQQVFSYTRKNQSKSQDISKNIEERQLNQELRQAFEKKVQEIKEQRRSNHRLNFITLNKSLVSTSFNLTTHFSQTHLKYAQKQEEVKRRKIVITEEKIKKLKFNLMRRELKKQAEDEANEIHKLLLRKEQMHKNWLVYIYFAGIFMNWMSKLKTMKQQKIQIQIKRMKAYCIQKNFHLKFSKNFSFEYRVKTLARNNLTLYSNSVFQINARRYIETLKKCVREITTYQNVNQKFDNFYRRWVLVQHHWRLYKENNKLRFDHLINFWGKITEKIVMKIVGKGKKKKKSHAAEKIVSIHQNIKEKYIKDHLLNCKKKFVKQIRKGENPRALNFMIEEETLTKVIMSFAGSKGKLQKKSTVVR